MREKLIEILSRTEMLLTSDEVTAIGVEARNLLRELRCDKCRHWGFVDRVTNNGTCETVPSDDYIWTKPDFFCALWEPKN